MFGNVTCAAVNEICMQSWTSCNNDDFEKQSNQKPCTKNNSDLYYALNICETPQIISFMHVPSSQFECWACRVMLQWSQCGNILESLNKIIFIHKKIKSQSQDFLGTLEDLDLDLPWFQSGHATLWPLWNQGRESSAAASLLCSLHLGSRSGNRVASR